MASTMYYGGDVYCKISAGGSSCLDNSAGTVLKCIDDILNNYTRDDTDVFSIADFGTADGSACLHLINQIIRLTQSQIKSEKLQIGENVFLFINGTSMYKQCLPSKIYRFRSSIALQLISELPCNIKDGVYYVNADEEEYNQFKEKAEEDWKAFVVSRGKGLKPGIKRLSGKERLALSQEQKKKKKTEYNQRYYNKHKKTSEKHSISSIHAIRKRIQREKQKEKQLEMQRMHEQNRSKNTAYKRKYKKRKRDESDNDMKLITREHLDVAFQNKMAKSRAMKRLKAALPSTPKKKASLLASYLDQKTPKSPTIPILNKLNIATSPEENADQDLGCAILQNVASAVKQTKNSRSSDARIAMNIITATLTGKNISENGTNKRLARELGLPVRRISGGRRLRNKILNSEKSCWTFIDRKTRKDALKPEIKRKMYDFWLLPRVSRPTGNKNDVKKVRTGPKQYIKQSVYILEKSQTEVFEDFKESHPDIIISQRTFVRLKPFFVRSATQKDRNTYCCRYHVEVKSLFRSCMDFRKKYLNDEEKELYPVFDNLSDIVALTLCPKDFGSDNFKRECLERTCEVCGIESYNLSPKEMDSDCNDVEVKWERYEYTQVRDRRKLVLVKKVTNPFNMFDYFVKLLSTFPSHQFRTNWQNKQLKYLAENLPIGHCVAIHDYSENYGCKEKNEVQSSYFHGTEVSLHVSIIQRHGVLEIDGTESTLQNPNVVTEQFFVVSPDLTHDQHFTHFVQEKVAEYLRSINCEVDTMHEFTDGCSSQYKSRHCMGDLTNSSEFYHKTIRNYFETSHAKGPQDATGGFLKNQVDLAVISGKDIIQSARDFYLYVDKNLQTVKSTTSTCKRRIFRFVESIPRHVPRCYKAIPNNRAIHQVTALSDKPDQIITKNLSCYTCEFCLEGDYNFCLNSNITGPAKEVKIQSERENQSNEDEEMRYNIEDLVTEGQVLAVRADDELEEFYIMKSLSSVEKLEDEKTDKWGIKYPKGMNIIRGFYYDKVKARKRTYKLLDTRLALVPACSVILICSDISCDKKIFLPESTLREILSVLEELTSF